MDLALKTPSKALTSNRNSCKEKLQEENQSTTICRECSVTCIYQVMIASSLRSVIITWFKASTIHSLTITIENLSNDNHQTCHIDFQSGQFWSRKGLKSLNVDQERVDIYWDFKTVKFSTKPEPSSNYYVAIVFDKHMVLLLGDSKAEACKRAMARPSTLTPVLLHKEEVLYGNGEFHTKVLLHDGHREHDIVIYNSAKRPKETELRISIDGRVVVRVMNLDWRFRGNETVLVNNVPVQIFWDVHDWLFGRTPSLGHGFFIFKPGSLRNIFDGNGYEDDGRDNCDEVSVRQAVGCCHFVFAVKVVQSKTML